MQKQISFTKEGYEKLQKEYTLAYASRSDAVKELSKAREMGDLSENGYYKSARFKLSQIDRQLRHLKHLLTVGKIEQSSQTGVVDIGTIVTVENNGQKSTYTIVGTYEAVPSEGKISLASPLGKALAGKTTGNTAAVSIGDTTHVYTITHIAQ